MRQMFFTKSIIVFFIFMRTFYSINVASKMEAAKLLVYRL